MKDRREPGQLEVAQGYIDDFKYEYEKNKHLIPGVSFKEFIEAMLHMQTQDETIEQLIEYIRKRQRIMKKMATVMKDLTRDSQEGNYSLNELTKLKNLVDSEVKRVTKLVNGFRDSYFKRENQS